MVTMPEPLPGIKANLVKTQRILLNVYEREKSGKIPVIFLHGNFSSALYWEETMLAMPAEYRPIAFDMRGYGWSEDKPVDATRGLADWSDDLTGLMQALGLKAAHFVGWSLGGGVLYRFIIDHPEKILSVTMINPVSPFGFGGTKGIEGQLCYPDAAGSGGGVVNPTFIQLIKNGDRSTDDPNSPRNVINGFYYKPPFRAAREEDFLTGALAEKTGEKGYPGDALPSPNWPGVQPGVWGPINAGAPKYILSDAPAVLAAQPKPSILWVRGSHDMIVSDNSMFDLGALGKLGYVPGWPGDEVYPPQPMVSQTRYFMEKYAAAGGKFKEFVIQDTAHGPHIEKPEEFLKVFLAFLKMH